MYTDRSVIPGLTRNPAWIPDLPAGRQVMLLLVRDDRNLQFNIDL